jgi:hypothetical protein
VPREILPVSLDERSKPCSRYPQVSAHGSLSNPARSKARAVIAYGYRVLGHAVFLRH